MEPIFAVEAPDNLELDYALVRHTKCQLSFKFPDQFRNKTTDDVDVTLVGSHDNKTATEANMLRLKYYIVISRHEIYPTSYNNTKQSGIFRTVTKSTSEAVEAADGLDVDEMLQITIDDIQTEAVNYVGYYSTHEQSMEAVMHLQARGPCPAS